MPKTAPAYGALVHIEEADGVYLREKALDAVQEQIVEDLNEALALLNGRGVLIESDYKAIGELIADISDALTLAKAAQEIAFSKTPPEEFEDE